MISMTPVGGNDIYSINRIDAIDVQGECVSQHYEIHDLFRRKCIAVCGDMDEAQRRFDAIFTPHE